MVVSLACALLIVAASWWLQAEAMVVKKGFSAVQLKNCLQEYEGLGVLHVDDDGTQISFD